MPDCVTPETPNFPPTFFVREFTFEPNGSGDLLIARLGANCLPSTHRRFVWRESETAMTRFP